MGAIIAGSVAGVIFAVGLVIAGMTQPSKVMAFLDFTGSWDPSLALVMGGAIAVYAPAYRYITGLRGPTFADSYLLPLQRSLDGRLLSGAALFGIGWGLAGYCPGPGIVALGTGGSSAVVFALSMLSGMFVHQLAQPLWTGRKLSGAGPVTTAHPATDVPDGTDATAATAATDTAAPRG